MRRAGQQEAALDAAAVDFHLQCRKESRRALHLVQNDAVRKVGDEADRIRFRRAPSHVLVETDVCVTAFLAHHAGESGLSALARTMNEDCRRVFQGLRKVPGSVPRIEIIHWHTIALYAANRKV